MELVALGLAERGFVSGPKYNILGLCTALAFAALGTCGVNLGVSEHVQSVFCSLLNQQSPFAPVFRLGAKRAQLPGRCENGILLGLF